MTTTAPISLREHKKLQTRRRLAETALRLFADRGYTRTSVEEIARAAEFSVPTFFRYFATKEDVAFYDQGSQMDDLPATVRGVSAEQVWPAVREATFEHLRTFQDPDSDLGQIRRSLWLDEPAVAKRFAEVVIEWERIVAAVFADALGLDVDRHPYPRMAAAAIIGAARAALVRQHRCGGSMIEHARACLALVEPALATPPTS